MSRKTDAVSSKKPSRKALVIKPANAISLYAEISEATDLLGDKALQIAVYDIDAMKTVMLLISQNTVAPGAFAEALVGVRKPDALKRSRLVIQEGPARELAVQWSSAADNLLHGLSTNEMAELCGLTKYDKRLDWYARTVSKAVRRAFSLEVGWYHGRFRILTASQVRAKESRLARHNVKGGAQRAEDRLGLKTGGEARPSDTLFVQAALFEDIEAQEKNND